MIVGETAMQETATMSPDNAVRLRRKIAIGSVVAELVLAIAAGFAFRLF